MHESSNNTKKLSSKSNVRSVVHQQENVTPNTSCTTQNKAFNYSFTTVSESALMGDICTGFSNCKNTTPTPLTNNQRNSICSTIMTSPNASTSSQINSLTRLSAGKHKLSTNRCTTYVVPMFDFIYNEEVHVQQIVKDPFYGISKGTY
ncbi:hypothetical protein R6Q59_035616 [Mikania micrantha]